MMLYSPSVLDFCFFFSVQESSHFPLQPDAAVTVTHAKHKKIDTHKKNIDDETEKNTKQQQITALYDSMGLMFENALPFAL